MLSWFFKKYGGNKVGGHKVKPLNPDKETWFRRFCGSLIVAFLPEKLALQLLQDFGIRRVD